MKPKISLMFLILLFYSGCVPKNEEVFKSVDKYNIYSETHNIQNNEELLINDVRKSKRENNNQQLPPNILKVNIKNKKYIKQMTTETQKNKKMISLKVENIPLLDFIKLTFGQIMNLNYIIDPNLNNLTKKITLNVDKKISYKEFFDLVKSILNTNGIIVKQKDNIFYLEKGKMKKVEKISDYIIYGRKIPSNLSGDTVITIIVPSYYVRYSKIMWMLKKFYLSQNAYVINYGSGDNILFITDKVANLKKALNFINIVDTPTLKNKYTSIIKLNYIDIDQFVNRLKDLLPASGVNIVTNLKDSGVIIKQIPELNSILVVSDKNEWIRLIKFWKNKLDELDVNSKTPQIFIYTPENRNSSELVKLVKSLFGNLVSKNKKNSNSTFKVINDVERNRVIVYTTPGKYKKIYEMLKKLDVLPKQVLIQVTIAEITLKDSLQYGFEWFLQHQGATSFNLGTLGNLGIGSGGIVGTIINSDQTFQSIMNFLAQKNLINILSSPKLLVLDNQNANINVGTQVPVLTSSTTSQNTDSTTTQVTQSVEYRNTGIILNVQPTIHSNGTLTLKISQTVSDPQPNSTSSISSPMILNRSINTNVILKSNQTLMLGGLIKQSIGKTVNKVPLLGDIPWLGNLFKTVSYSKDKTELIIMVKPIIINNSFEGKKITDQFKNMIINLNKD